MFYSIVDLISGKSYGFDSRQGLQFRWRELTSGAFDYFSKGPKRVSFDELNVTGHDITWDYVSIPATYDDAGDLITEGHHEYVRRLRRYQVIDQDGRSCDIRMWKREIAEAESTAENLWRSRMSKWNAPRFRIDPVCVGHKQHYRCASTPSFRYKKYLMDAETCGYKPDEEDEYADLMPILDHSAPRHNELEYRGWKSSDYRSWKRMHKSGAQWAKHKKGRSKNVLRRGDNPITDEAGLTGFSSMLDVYYEFEGTDLQEAVLTQNRGRA